MKIIYRKILFIGMVCLWTCCYNYQSLAQVNSDVKKDIISIADAKTDSDSNHIPDKLGEIVTVAGRVTVSSGILSNEWLHIAIQDKTSGIFIYNRYYKGSPIHEGDSLIISGVIGQFRGITQLLNPQIVFADTINRRITKPILFKNKYPEYYEGQLVTLKGLIVNKRENDGGKFLVITLSEGSDSTLIIFNSVYQKNPILLDKYEIGESISVTGLLSQHDYSENPNDNYQILPRTAGDLNSIGFSDSFYLKILGGIFGFAILILIFTVSLRIQLNKRTKKLNESEQRFESMANVAPVGIFRTLPNGYTTYVNPKWTELSGLSAEKALGDDWLSAVHPEDREQLKAKWNTEKQQNKTSAAEYRFLHQSGKEITVLGQAEPEFDANNKLTGFIGSITDITDWKLAELELKSSKEKYKYLFQNNPQPMWIYDIETLKFLEVNDTSIDIYGYSHEEFSEMTLKDVRPKGDIEALVEDVKKTNTKINNAGIWRHIKKNGEIIYVEIISHELQYENRKARLVLINDITKRKLAQVALQESEYSLNEAQMIAKMGDWKFDLIEDITKWSDNCFRLYGLNPGEIEPSYDYFRSIILPEDLHLVDQAYEIIQKTKTSAEIEFRIVLPDGNTKWILNKIIPTFENGTLIELKGVNIDIDILKKSLLALKESEEKFRSIFENHSAIKLLIDPETGSIVDANIAAANFYGWSQDELKKMKIQQINQLPAPAVVAAIKKIVNGENKHFEFRHKLADESIRDVEVFSSKVNIDGKVYLHSIIQDVTEKVEIENKLKLLSKSVEQSPVLILIANNDGNIEYVNQNFTEVTGYTSEEAIGQNIRLLVPIENDIEFYKKLWVTVSTGENWTGEFLNKKKNGEVYWGSTIISPIKDQFGETTHFVAVQEDISEKKKLHDDLIIAKEKAEESDRLKTSFLNNISHEIRTPMNGILGFTELLKMPDLTGDEKENYFRLIDLSGRRMINTISDIVEISKIETGQVEIIRKKTNLNQIVNEVYSLYKTEANVKKLEFNSFCEFESDAAEIITDEHKLSQAIKFLVNNAIKFTKTGAVNFGYKTATNNIQFYVKDTGIGLTAKQKEIVFQRFMQGSSMLTRNYEGVGLGLSISMAYIEMLGGKIWVDSELGKGSVFYFEIPFTPSKPGQQNKNKKPVGFGKTYVLLVEDDPVSMMFLKLLLNKENMVLLEATNGKEAVEKIQTNPEIKLVIMDLKMPVMDGFEATKQIKLIRPEVNVIAQTAFAFSEDKEKAISAGCDEVITKPIKKELLLNVMANYISLEKS